MNVSWEIYPIEHFDLSFDLKLELFIKGSVYL